MTRQTPVESAVSSVTVVSVVGIAAASIQSPIITSHAVARPRRSGEGARSYVGVALWRYSRGE